MSRRFAILAAGWLLLVTLAAPFVLEWFDQRGSALLLPGLSVTGSEIVFGLQAALLPFLVRAVFRRLRPRAPF